LAIFVDVAGRDRRTRMIDYSHFLASKHVRHQPTGFHVELDAINSHAFDWQKLIVQWAVRRGRAALFEDCGMGKCHGRGTEVLMHDGSIKKVEDVVVGDLLMGDDSTPRKVLSLARGREMMYRVTLRNGDSYTCNESHIFALQMSNRHAGIKHGERISMPLTEYLELPDYAKRNTYKHYKSAVDFDSSPVSFDPYLYGAWLGDGHSKGPSWTINSRDTQIADAVLEYADSHGLCVREQVSRGCSTWHMSHGPTNSKRYFEKDFLRDSAINGKRIYREYLINSREVRMEVLAGLVDTDGYTIDNCHEISTKWTGLRDDILFLARSLGFACTHSEKIVDETTYYRISISGHTHLIPCRTRKKAGERRQIKTPLVYGFTVTQIGEGDYYGFTLDGNHLYLLGDFTVTHNTIQMLEWSRIVNQHTGKNVLILCPLAVQWQLHAEADKFGIPGVHVAESQADVQPGITITNYDKLHHFDAGQFVGVCLDESSILKSYAGTTKRKLIETFARTPYRLACTATPAPNDMTEIGNHSEFLGVMPSPEMLSRWFINDGAKTGVYRLRNHGIEDYWRWVASWAVAISSPADLGFPSGGYDLPPFKMKEHVIAGKPKPGQLFATHDTISATEVHEEKRQYLEERAAKVAEIVQGDDQWAIWVDTDYEDEAISKLIPDAVVVRGSHPAKYKEEMLMGFASGKVRRIITKASLAGFGLNWQGCHRMTWFAGYSYEQFYQALRRLWRFGQSKTVECHLIRTENESSVCDAVNAKQARHAEFQREVALRMSAAMKEELGLERQLERYVPTERVSVPNWMRSKA
jgi:hypothetical protein